MVPAPSGLQEVDGLNHLLGNPRPDRYSVPRCIGNDLVCYIAGTAAELPSGPHGSSPERLLKVRKFRHPVVRLATAANG